MSSYSFIAFVLIPRYQQLSAQVFGARITAMGKHADALLTNHSNDPTGQLGEDAPIWFNLMVRYKQHCESNSATARARASRQGNRDVQDSLGANQPPLGPGNQARRSEIAAENQAQVRGPVEIGADLEIVEEESVAAPQIGSPQVGAPQVGAPQVGAHQAHQGPVDALQVAAPSARRVRRNRTGNAADTGSRRNNRQRTC